MTTDEILTTGSSVVLVVQMIAPLALGALPLVHLARSSARARAEEKDVATPAPSATPTPAAVAPLRCPSCDAPVPLTAADFPCPFCHAAIHPPEAYQRLLALRGQARQELARAERLWRFSRISSSLLVVWLCRIALVAWSLAVLFAIAVKSEEWPRLVLWLPAIVMIVQGFVGLAEISALRDMRKMLPPVPARAAFAVAAGNGDCPECGAPVHFDAERLATTCGYCGADAYRAALAEAARTEAQATEARSRKQLREAVADVRSRREELGTFFSFLAFAELFYAVFLAIAAVYDLLFG
jgi:Zn finger protein HypA/HybF involved in hydrogenase expression